MVIWFQPDNKKCEVTKEDNLLFAAEKAGAALDGACGGVGTCGKCKIKVISGEVSGITEEEKKLLTEKERQEGYRLACKTKPLGNLVIELPERRKDSERKKDMAILPENFLPEPVIKKVYKKVKRASMQEQRSDCDRIQAAFEMEDMKIDRTLLSKIHGVLEEERGDVTAVFSGNKMIGLEAGDTTNDCYGLAVDIGTTTVVGMLWDIRRTKLIEVTARTNPQSIFGADVISRIQFCNEDESHLARMQEAVIQCINEMIKEMTLRSGIRTKNIYEAVVVGNTTMSHLFLGVHPGSLARTPFAPVFCHCIDTPAKELSLFINEGANVCFLPNIAGHVGADLSAVLLATGLKEKEGANIVIDIGTNGEILLEKDGEILACSTAAGPAFEGASITMGMRAADGAIEKVSIESEENNRVKTIRVKTIGNVPPEGICGSGLIDGIACLLQMGIIDKTGRMITEQEALEAGIVPELAERVIVREKGLAYILDYKQTGEPVVITQQDIREVQLAKGAICAGMKTMMKMLQIKEQELNHIYLAGAFGNYIDKKSALAIGLLPDVPEEKIQPIGNAAGAGACMALLSGASRKLVKSLAQEVKHVELSMNMDFQEEYLKAMNF